jgi:hypothetical protein
VLAQGMGGISDGRTTCLWFRPRQRCPLGETLRSKPEPGTRRPSDCVCVVVPAAFDRFLASRLVLSARAPACQASKAFPQTPAFPQLTVELYKNAHCVNLDSGIANGCASIRRFLHHAARDAASLERQPPTRREAGRGTELDSFWPAG